MDDRVNFDINNSLRDYLSDPTAVQCPEVDSRLVDCETDPERLSDSTINSVLEGIIDDVANNPETITRGIHFDSLQWLLKCAPLPLDSLFSLPRDLDPHSEQSNNFRNSANLSVSAISKILDLITSTLSTVIDQVNAAIEADEADSAQDLRQLLEIYGFFLQWTISAVEAKALEKPSKTAAARGRGKSSKSATAMKDEAHWDSIGQEQIALEVMCKAMKLKLSKIFVTTSERDTFVSLFTRPVYLILENEQRIKVTALRMHCFKLLCMAIKHHGHAHGLFGIYWICTTGAEAHSSLGAQVSIIQNLSYFEHLAEPMAELLHILAEQYDYPQLAEDVIRYLRITPYNG